VVEVVEPVERASSSVLEEVEVLVSEGIGTVPPKRQPDEEL